MRWTTIATHVPPNAEHVATVGQAVREIDAVRWGISFTTVDLDDPDPNATSGMIPRVAQAPATREWGGSIIDRERRIADLDVKVTTRAGRRTATVSGSIDGYDITVALEVPAEVDGIDLYSTDARQKLSAAAARAWAAAMRGS